jgi:hypothetical protein
MLTFDLLLLLHKSYRDGGQASSVEHHTQQVGLTGDETMVRIFHTL